MQDFQFISVNPFEEDNILSSLEAPNSDPLEILIMEEEEQEEWINE